MYSTFAHLSRRQGLRLLEVLPSQEIVVNLIVIPYGRMVMNNARWLKLINPALLVLVVWQAATGMASDILGKVFEVVHPLAGILLVLFVAIHIFFNRAWIKVTYFKKK
jgi:hypothetical protein